MAAPDHVRASLPRRAPAAKAVRAVVAVRGARGHGVTAARRPAFLLVLLVALSTAFGGAASASPREAQRALIGREAPDFTQRLMAGGNFRLSERRGEVVLLGFWTSWCGGCREQLERLARLDATYGSAGLVVVGVSLDDDPVRAREFRAALDAPLRSVLDAEKRLGREYRVNDLPMTVLIDRAGTVRHVHGEISRRGEAALIEEIRRLLDE
ncbi:MAG: TlpA disulfide reductase family protein [Steroidobacteraceae bacterium]|nr:TlpA disulfide reductase family protein [Steroidobacteraceae bacterium]